MSAPSSSREFAQLSTGVALLDTALRVTWLNDALAEILQIGVRGVRGQDFAALVAGASFREHVARVRSDQPGVKLRAMTLHTLNGGTLRADLDVQLRADDQLLLEVHPLAETPAEPTPLSATLRGFAHEVKNPLAGLRGAAQLLQRRVGDEELAALAGMVIGEADRLATLADRLLHHDGRPQLGPVNLHALLDRVQAVLAGQPQPPDIEHDYDPSLPDCVGDADRLQQVLLNLARNAVEAGATTLTLRTRVEHGVRLGECVVRTVLRVDVQDDGSGVPEEVRDNLFQPLVSGRADGTGLGLALARETAHEHGGQLRYSSHPGVTIFSLYLPLDTASPASGDKAP